MRLLTRPIMGPIMWRRKCTKSRANKIYKPTRWSCRWSPHDARLPVRPSVSPTDQIQKISTRVSLEAVARETIIISAGDARVQVDKWLRLDCRWRSVTGPPVE